MVYNFDELNIKNIFNLLEKFRDGNTTIEFCQKNGLHRHSTVYCPFSWDRIKRFT